MAGMWWDQAAWQRMEMRGPDYERYWDLFDARFHFRPSMTVYPGIVEPTPSVTFDLRPIFAAEPSEWVRGEDRLTGEVLDAMKAVFGVERLVVLNWQHDALWFVPEEFEPVSEGDWAIPVFPNGDYFIYLTESMDDGFFGHPWEQTFCVFGERLLPSLDRKLGTWLTVARRDGREATANGPEVGPF